MGPRRQRGDQKADQKQDHDKVHHQRRPSRDLGVVVPCPAGSRVRPCRQGREQKNNQGDEYHSHDQDPLSAMSETADERRGSCLPEAESAFLCGVADR